MHVIQLFESGEELPGLTRSIIKPLGKFGNVGNESKMGFKSTELLPFIASLLFVGEPPNWFDNGGEIRSAFFLTDCRVFGGEIEDTR